MLLHLETISGLPFDVPCTLTGEHTRDENYHFYIVQVKVLDLHRLIHVAVCDLRHDDNTKYTNDEVYKDLLAMEE
jgi:hypothetical protein